MGSEADGSFPGTRGTRVRPQGQHGARGRRNVRRAVCDPNAGQYLEALQMLGDHYTQRGIFDRSLRVDQQLSRLQPANPLVFYNLACSHSLSGEFDQATAALEKALTLGYRDFKWLARDPDLHQLRQHPFYRGIQSKIRRMKVEIA